MKKAIILLSVIVALQGALLGFVVWRGMMHEHKIREMDTSLSFVILTDNGKNQQALDVWTRLATEQGGTRRLFTWVDSKGTPIQKR